MSSPQCGLCGGKGRLTVTECCNNLICDDEADYDPLSPVLNSCHGNHKRSTLCAYHYNEQHKAADWRKCKECWDGFDPAEAEDYATNSFNFKEKNENECKECKEIIDVKNDDFVKRSGNYYCLDCALNQEKLAQSSESQNQVQIGSQAAKREDQIVKEESKVPEQPVSNVQNKSEQSGSKSSQNQIGLKGNKHVESQNQDQATQVDNEASNVNKASTSLRASRIDSSGKKTPMKSVETQTLDQEMSTGRKYGKRKAKAEEVVEVDEEVKSSTRKRSGKKVKKNDDEQGSGNKKNVEIITEKRNTRSSSSKAKGQGSSSKKEVNDSEDLEVQRTRSSSNRKEKSKKKVGTKKRL